MMGKQVVGDEGFAVDASLIQADANKQRSVPSAASEVTPTFISPSDPAAQWTGAHRGPAFFAYATNDLVDTDNAIPR